MALEDKIRSLLARNASDAAHRASEAASNASFAASSASDAAREAARAAGAASEQDLSVIANRLIGLQVEDVSGWLNSVGVELTEEGFDALDKALVEATEDDAVDVDSLDNIFDELEIELTEEQIEALVALIAETYPGFGRNREATSPSQGSSQVPPVSVLDKGAKGGADQRGSQATLAAGSGPFEKKPPKQGSSEEPGVEELDKEAPGKAAGDKATPVSGAAYPTATGAGDAPNFTSVMDPVAAANERSRKGNVYREDIEKMFSGDQTDLSEEFKTKVTTLYEATVEARVAEERIKLEEQMAEESATIVASIQEELINEMDAYLGAVVEEWLKENEVEVTSLLRTEIAESFMSGLRNLFLEHSIDVPDENVNLVEELQDTLAEALKLIEAQAEKIEELNQDVVGEQREVAFREVTEGMTPVSVEKLRTLTEAIPFDNVDTFKEKIQVVRKNFVETHGIPSKTADTTEEGETVEKVVNPAISSYLDALDRSTSF